MTQLIVFPFKALVIFAALAVMAPFITVCRWLP